MLSCEIKTTTACGKHGSHIHPTVPALQNAFAWIHLLPSSSSLNFKRTLTRYFRNYRRLGLLFLGDFVVFAAGVSSVASVISGNGAANACAGVPASRTLSTVDVNSSSCLLSLSPPRLVCVPSPRRWGSQHIDPHPSLHPCGCCEPPAGGHPIYLTSIASTLGFSSSLFLFHLSGCLTSQR